MNVFSIAAKFSTWSFFLGNGAQVVYSASRWLHTAPLLFEKAVKGSLVTIVATKDGLFAASKNIYRQENNDDK